MPDPSPELVEAIFQEALDLEPQQRRSFLDDRCAGDAGLRAAVEELLHFDEKAQTAQDFLRSPAADVRAAVPASVGRYRIVRRLAEGGMGTVYEAEQDDPRRTVALKVMRLGLDSPELRKRFAQEARILGRLHHTGIAQVYDAGATEDGRLYFAMEFICGLPLGEHVRLRGLTPPARLELVARVCDAVEHAHKQGVIHRDLKPANILVEDTGQPKVLDFGVAHATGGGLLDTTAHTRPGQILGTLGYMSPEQVAGDPQAIDARSDVYALGVILYELLADRLPLPLDHLPLPDVIRVVQEVEPSRLGSINASYRGDVETIVGKALAKDKTRRYASAGDWPRTSGDTWATSRSGRGRRRRCTRCGNSHGGTRAWWAGCWPPGWPWCWGWSARSSSPSARSGSAARPTRRSARRSSRSIAPASPPRWRPCPCMTWRMPRASSRTPRRNCATGNGSTCRAGSTTASR
jgi:serine/threonine protein kinase